MTGIGKRIILLLTLSLGLFTHTLLAQPSASPDSEKTRLLFLLDASGSMLAPWENDIRMNVAKKLLADLVDSLKVNKDLELALRVYGHQFPNRLLNCKDSKLEVSFKAGNHDLIKKKLFALVPQGTTPIAYSLEQSAADFPEAEKYRNVVIIITDGLESCNGDPCKVSEALQRKGIFLKPFVIGLGASEGWEKQFDCVGQYFDAKNEKEFRKVFNKVFRQSLDKTTLSVELLDSNNKPKETNVNVTLFNQINNSAIVDFVHFRNRLGKTDSLEVDALITYDIVVNTVPQVIHRNVELKGGQHNVVSIKAPQGSLLIQQTGSSEYREGVRAIVRLAGHGETIHTQKVNNEGRFLVGKYDLEVLTFPRTYYRNVSVNQSQKTIIQVPEPGLLNISGNTDGYGSLYQISTKGAQEWISNLELLDKKSTFAMQPGDYKLVFRAKNALGSKFTEIKTFTIKSGGAVNIKLFGR